MNWIKSLLAACLLSVSPVLATEVNRPVYHALFDYEGNWYNIQIIPGHDREVNYIYLEGKEGWSHIRAYCFNNELVRIETNGENHPPELQQMIATEWCKTSYAAQTEYWE